MHHPETSAPLNECTKCRACADACPMHAIALPFLPKRDVIPVEVVEDELANR
ncbi:4Fe-4S dicluster domain-containing protein [Eggerthella sinensis]|nr:4Fe-4S dicluster domain-containing protein [Eggerthella sinensis]